MMVKSVAGVAWTAQSWPGGHGRAYQDTPAGRTIHNLRFSGSQLCPVSARRQGAARMSRTLTFPPRARDTLQRRCPASGGWGGGGGPHSLHIVIASAATCPRSFSEGGSNPESLRCGRLDCFAALAMTEQGASILILQMQARFADTSSHPRGAFRSSFASSLHPQIQEGAGK